MQSAFNSSVFDKVVLAVERAAGAKRHGISLMTRLSDDLALGGFGRLKLAIYLEEGLGLELSDEVLERFVTVADIVSYSSRRYFKDAEFPTLAAAA